MLFPSRRLFAVVLFGILVGPGAQALWCAVPSQINFQGKLLDKSNNPRNGNFDFTFKIYDALSAGNLLWSETQTAVPVSNGVFAVRLGAASAISPAVFAGANAYLETTVGTEVGSPRQPLVAAPYAFKAAAVDAPLPAGDTQYVQVGSVLQSGATFYVSSGTVAGPLTVGGIIVAGSGANAVTTAAGLLDATKLAGTLPNAQLSGTYSNALTFSSPSDSFAGDGTNLVNVSAAHLLPGDTNYIQNRATLQAGSVFYASSGTVGGAFTATGTVKLGGAAGVNDVSVTSNLTVNGNLTASGAGPHVFGGNVKVNGNGLVDSGGTTRITLGQPNLIAGDLSVPSGAGLSFSTSVVFNGTPNSDNYIAYPFTASNNVNVGNAVIISGANTVGVVAVNSSVASIGFAVTSASSGQTVWVALSGIVTTAVSGGAINVGNRVCTSSAAAGSVAACTTNGAPIGKALTGTTAAGQTLSVVIYFGN